MGKIATASGESKWITGEKARAYGMHLRQGSDAILVGVNTVLADDPSLTMRNVQGSSTKKLQRIILDSQARTSLKAKVISDAFREFTTVVVSRSAPDRRVKALARKVRVLVAPEKKGRIDLRWLLKKLGSENITSLLVEGGGEVNASFLLEGLAIASPSFTHRKYWVDAMPKKEWAAMEFRNSMKPFDWRKWNGDDWARICC